VVLDTDHGTVAGLGLPSGVTVLVGASASGAGAWLSALESEAGVSPGGTAMFAGPVGTIRATRRAIGPIDLSAFVHACPEVPQPENVHYDDAPAPLAAAASIVEAVEAGARVLLFDEDDLPAGALGTDGRMQRILGEHPSPVVPLVDRLADLRERWGVSIVIAARAIGDFFEASDTVLVLRDDGLDDATEASRRIARATSGFRVPSPLPVSFPPPPRDVRVRPADSGPPIKIGVWGGRGVRLGDDLVDLSDTPIVRDAGRLRAIAVLLKRAAVAASDWQPVGELLDSLVAASARDALAEGEEQGLCDLARPSRLEIAGALARWKRVEFRTAPVTLRRSAR
jgi:predicted ABC-class ATPase